MVQITPHSLQRKLLDNNAVHLQCSARPYTIEAIDTLVALMRTGKNERVRGTAAQALLDRGWGKPKVEVVTDEKQDYIAALMAVNERLRQA